ncbi:hypothetical protein EDC94DRAFT_594092 [Helicostylum pulchrum]|nr:hypothetical protein EDC94DRAFT_594092 [Helicostylum pulchrum]
MTTLNFIFSLKGITLIALTAFFVWLLTGYPQWKQQRTTTTTTTTHTNHDSLKTKISTEIASLKQEAGQQVNNPEANGQQDTQGNNRPIKDLSLAHYILVTPFAALYILGRVILDTVRYSVYFVIWSCERSIPHIDDWLFDKVTIWLPKKYSELEQWWIYKGKPSVAAYSHHFQHATLPAIIKNTETFFETGYRIGCTVSSATQDFIDAWKRFTQRHDWHQLTTDLGNVAYIVIWAPLVWVVIRSVRLANLVYSGLRSVAISVQGDVVWICSTLIPAVYDYMITTRLAQWIYIGILSAGKGMRSTCLALHQYVLVPTLGRFLIWLVKSIDQAILLLQDHTIQQKLHRIYKWMAPKIVWTILEFSGVFLEIVKWAHSVCIQLLYPAYRLFMKRVLPSLAIAYQKIVVHWGYELHLYPAWVKVYPYLNTPLLWAYTNVTVPLLNGVYTFVASISNHVTRLLLVKLQIILNKAIEISIFYSQWSYRITQSWLLKQAPVLSEIIQNSYQVFLNACDWDSLKQDTVALCTDLYDWIQVQSNLVYLSIERSLSSWVKEQGGEGGEKQKLA